MLVCLRFLLLTFLRIRAGKFLKKLPRRTCSTKRLAHNIMHWLKSTLTKAQYVFLLLVMAEQCSNRNSRALDRSPDSNIPMVLIFNI